MHVLSVIHTHTHTPLSKALASELGSLLSPLHTHTLGDLCLFGFFIVVFVVVVVVVVLLLLLFPPLFYYYVLVSLFAL